LSGRGVDTEELAPHQLAFNVVPHVGAFAKGHPQSSEELAAALDVARAFDKAPVVRMTALHVPVFHGLSLALSMQLTNPAEAEAVRAALKANDKVKVVDAPDESIYPTTQLTAADDAVLVGRIRTAGNHVWLVAAVDNAAFVAHGAVRLALELLY
jgi:aspartate-semialdehyde dehydrogenase